MRMRPNVSDLERSWKPLINKEEKTIFKLQSKRSKKFQNLQLQSKKIVPTKSNRISILFFWYSERQHCLSLQYTMLASHHLTYIKLKQSVQWSMLCLCWFVWITVAWIEFSCGVRFAIHLCINFPILQNICFVDPLYFLILYWGVMKTWTVWFFDCISKRLKVMLCFIFPPKTC